MGRHHTRRFSTDRLSQHKKAKWESQKWSTLIMGELPFVDQFLTVQIEEIDPWMFLALQEIKVHIGPLGRLDCFYSKKKCSSGLVLVVARDWAFHYYYLRTPWLTTFVSTWKAGWFPFEKLTVSSFFY